jgi:exosortase
LEQFQTDKGQIAATFVQVPVRTRRRLRVISAAQAASIAFLAAGVLLYGPTIVKLVYDWWTNPDYSHGLVVLPLALALVWHRRRELADAPAAPSALGLGIVAGSLLILILGTLGAELFLTRASLLTFVAGTIVFLFGWRHLRLIAFPLVLLALTIPIPAIVISRLTLSLQFCASAIAEAILWLFRIPVLREGNVLVLPNATLQVAEACSGIRSMTALGTLALVVARFGSTRWMARALIIAAAVPIAVVVNGLRVAAAAIGARWFGAAAVEGAVHEALGWVMFLVAFGMMALWARLVNSAVPEGRDPEKVALRR